MERGNAGYEEGRRRYSAKIMKGEKRRASKVDENEMKNKGGGQHSRKE
jgi:hypothetical protein